MNQDYELAPQKTNLSLACFKSSVARRAREGILPLYSALMGPQMEYCIQLGSAQPKKDRDLLDDVEKGRGNFPWNTPPMKTGFFSLLEKKRP